MSTCFFASLPGAGPCDGGLVRCHLIPKQLLRRELSWQDPIAFSVRRQQMNPPYRDPTINLWDERVWVWGCGGIMGNGGHHGMLDHSRTLRIPRDLLPAAVEQYAAENGLTWYLDREYGSKAEAA